MANLQEAAQLDWVTALFDVLFLRFANFPLAHIPHKASHMTAVSMTNDTHRPFVMGS
jgi:hypothetical protein